MYCKYCGKVIDDDSKFCTDCGNNVSGEMGDAVDKPSKAFAVLGFFLPLVGLILYAIYERKQPKRAKSAGKGALVGFITKVVISIIITVLYVVFVASVMRGTVDVLNDVGTYNYSGSMEKDDDYIIEFSEFKVSNNGYHTDTALEVTLTNTDDEQKTFFITVEAVGEDGLRLGTDILMADRLNPKQKIKEEIFKFVPDEKINQYKTATFKVLEVNDY